MSEFVKEFWLNPDGTMYASIEETMDNGVVLTIVGVKDELGSTSDESTFNTWIDSGE